ncbi:hypothetical protein EYB25_005418 [Talaromyces marneffei]|nr:hypothetical protein EYB25_005418 [Talaromyces marneffei]
MLLSIRKPPKSTKPYEEQLTNSGSVQIESGPSIGHNLEDWETKLPYLIPTSEREKSMGMIGHEGHDRCTFELCEYSILNYTSVTQRHEYGVASCSQEKRCSTLKGLFSVDKLDEPALVGRPTGWRLDGKSTIDVAEP